jgi:hypothetical protein
VLLLRISIAATLAIAAVPIWAQHSVLHAGGGWAAIDFGSVCEARARSVLRAPGGRPQATAGFAFSPDRRRWGEFNTRLSRLPRPGSTVMATIGRQPFLLVVRGGEAWSRGPAQEQAMIAAARSAEGLRIEGRDASGRRFRDTYALAGAPTAIDAAAARCAGKSAPR